MVKVYSINECPWCEKTKKYLKSRNVDFEEHNIELNDDDRDACYKLSGDLMVPVVTADDKAYVMGFDKAKLDELNDRSFCSSFSFLMLHTSTLLRAVF